MLSKIQKLLLLSGYNFQLYLLEFGCEIFHLYTDRKFYFVLKEIYLDYIAMLELYSLEEEAYIYLYGDPDPYIFYLFPISMRENRYDLNPELNQKVNNILSTIACEH